MEEKNMNGEMKENENDQLLNQEEMESLEGGDTCGWMCASGCVLGKKSKKQDGECETEEVEEEEDESED
ncbi:MAG: hypothetical protein LUH22_16135 [Bacteroides sp.]|nr:hypothetical protein [Bacteroides sp.]